MITQIDRLADPVFWLAALFVGGTGGGALSVLVYRRRISVSLPAVAAALAPALITGYLINDPWFAVSRSWDLLRLGLLVSWLPALIMLERKNLIAYQSAAAKWAARYAIYAALALFTFWAGSRVESGDMVQTFVDDSGRRHWLVRGNDGEDLFLFTRPAKGSSMLLEKVADSVGPAGTYRYHLHPGAGGVKLLGPEESCEPAAGR
ncbi:MAG: hypothetical protein ACYC2I_12340 [Elusimicrobiales bacterium]